MKLVALLVFTLNLYASDINQLKERRVIRFFKYHANQVMDELSEKSLIYDIKGNQIDIDHLRNQLEKTTISVSDKDLVDNTGSLVDVIGEPLKLILRMESWITFQKSGKDLRPLIIHELLRIASINDDDYLISRPLYKSLTLQSNESSAKAPYCNMRVAKTKTTTSKKKFKGVGFQPMNTSGGTIIFSSNSSNESYENAVKDVKEQCEKAGYYGFQYINGQTRMESRNTNGFVRMETKTTISAYCFKDKIKKRRKKDIRKESCKKASLCEETYKAAPEGQVSKSLYDELTKIKKENRCG